MRIMSDNGCETILREDIERLGTRISSSELTAELGRDNIGVAMRPILGHDILVGSDMRTFCEGQYVSRTRHRPLVSSSLSDCPSRQVNTSVFKDWVCCL
jgi:hypothetical protein